MGRMREHLKINKVTYNFIDEDNKIYDKVPEECKTSSKVKIANRAWLYYRLSREDDSERNSLDNQRNILVDYAQNHNLEIMGESFDDGISGMHFLPPGIEEMNEAVDHKLIDIVLVKDLSRLGRHKTQTAMFIEYLKEHKVRVISTTENIDTSNENDDLIIGVKQLLNDQYSRDISRKIRSGFKQKLKGRICYNSAV